MNAVSTGVTALVGRFAEETPFELPVIDYRLILPIVIVLTAGVVSVIIEAFAPRRARRPLQLTLVFVSLIAAFIAVIE